MNNKMPENTKHKVSNRLLFRLYQCNNLLHKTASKVIEHHAISSQQWVIMAALFSTPHPAGLTIGELIAFLKVSRQNLGGVLSRLQRQGIVCKTIDPDDGRSRRIALTDKGRQIWLDSQGDIENYYQEILGDFTTAELEHVLHQMSRFLDNMSKL